MLLYYLTDKIDQYVWWIINLQLIIRKVIDLYIYPSKLIIRQCWNRYNLLTLLISTSIILANTICKSFERFCKYPWYKFDIMTTYTKKTLVSIREISNGQDTKVIFWGFDFVLLSYMWTHKVNCHPLCLPFVCCCVTMATIRSELSTRTRL